MIKVLFKKVINLFSNWSISDFAMNWIIFFSIIYQKLVPLGFLIWILSAWKEWKTISIKHIVKSIYKTPGFWFIIYYFLLIIGMFWTENIDFGLSKLENKLSFFLLPFLIIGTRLHTGLNQWKGTFIVGILLSLSLYEIVGIYKTIFYSGSNSIKYLIELNFTLFMHRGYYACYLVIGVILLLEKNWKNFSFLNLLFILFLIMGVFQTFSKAGIGCLLIVLILFTTLKLYSRYLILSIAIVGAISIISVVVLATENKLSDRFYNMVDAIQNTPLKNNPSKETNSVRILMWSASAEVIKENPIVGVGTGDYDDELAKKNLEFSNIGVYEQRLNSHSQFLNTWVQLGFIGFAILSLIFIIPMTGSFNFFKLLILITFFINFLFESFLETQSGIILFCLLFMLLFSPKSIFSEQLSHNKFLV